MKAMNYKINVLLMMALLIAGTSCGHKNKQAKATMSNEAVKVREGLEVATFGSGCFWCTEAIFQNVDGVEKVESGYTGGKVKNPTYKEVCSGLTEHAEAVRIYYDPAKVTYDELLEMFWKTHDP